MHWKETSPGRFERGLDPSEAFFVSLYSVPHPPGKERWAMTAIASFKTDLSQDEIPQALRHAWKELRYRFPVLAASLETTSKIYEVPTEEALESWLDRTIVVEPLDADADTVIGSYVSTKDSVLHYLPGSSQVLIHTSHWRTDGVGITILTNAFFDALANPRDISFGDEGARLSPSMEEVLGPMSDVSEEKLAYIQDKWDKSTAKGRSVAIPIRAYGPAKGTFRKTHLFSEKTTSDIVAACKKLGVSVTTVLHAVLVATLDQLDESEPDQRANRMAGAPVFNLRPYMPAPFKSTDHPLTVMVVGEPFSADLQDFGESIKQISAFYSKNLASDSERPFLSLASAYNEFNAKLFTTPPKPPLKPAEEEAATPAPSPPPKPASTPSLNSMGILDRYIDHVHKGRNHFEITDYWFATEILGPILLFYVWTFRGKMRLTPYYNEIAFQPQDVQKFLDAFRVNLLKTLNVSE